MTRSYSRMVARTSAVVLVGLATGFCVLLPTPAGAKSQGGGVSAVAVARACKRTAGCDYIGTTSGHMTGCSPHACFDCNKGKCYPLAKKGPTGTTRPGGGNSAGTTTAARSNSVHQPVIQHSGSGHSGGSKH